MYSQSLQTFVKTFFKTIIVQTIITVSIMTQIKMLTHYQYKHFNLSMSSKNTVHVTTYSGISVLQLGVIAVARRNKKPFLQKVRKITRPQKFDFFIE